MPFNVIIPARYGSQRFPGKPLIDLKGKTMIERVYAAGAASKASRVCVATDDERIAAAVTAFGGEHVMTRPDHPSGSDRVHEAALLLGLSSEEVIVNLQGDEPLMPASVINQVAEAIATHQVQMASLCEPIAESRDLLDPGVVKVVRDERDHALYFSRSPIPWSQEASKVKASSASKLPADGKWFRHLGIYAYTLALLNDFVSWPAAMLEQAERLEQLRALEHGIKIHLGLACESIPPGIDTPADLERVLPRINP